MKPKLAYILAAVVAALLVLAAVVNAYNEVVKLRKEDIQHRAEIRAQGEAIQRSRALNEIVTIGSHLTASEVKKGKMNALTRHLTLIGGPYTFITKDGVEFTVTVHHGVHIQ